MEISDRQKSIFIFMRPRGTYNSDIIKATLPEQSRGWEEDAVSLYDVAGWGALCTEGNEGPRKEVQYIHFQEPQWATGWSL